VQDRRLGPADAVLGRDRPAVLGGQPQHRVIHAVIVRRRAEHVHVQVARTDVAEHDRARIRPGAPIRLGDHRIQLGPEAREPGQRHGHVELVRDACHADRLRMPLPVGPQPRAGRRIHRRRSVLELREHHHPFGIIFRSSRIHKQVCRIVALQRSGQPGVRADQGQARGLEVLGGPDGGHQRPDLGLQGGGGLDARHAGQHGDRGRLGGPQPEPGRGDDREGSLAARDELGQVVTGVVGLDAAEPADHAAVGQRGLQPEQLGARRAVPDRLDAAGVGRDRAAHRRGIPGRQVHAVLQADPGRVRAQFRDRHPGTRRDLSRQRVDRIEPAQPPGGKQHRGPAGRHPAAHQSGVPALRHDRGTVTRAGEQRPGHLVDVTGADHAAGGAAEPARPVRRVPGGDVGIGEHVLGSADRDQLGEQGVHEYSPYGPALIYSALQIRVRPSVRGIHHGMGAEDTAFR
jgi:hypothetical protein